MTLAIDTQQRENDQRANDLDINRILDAGLPSRQILLAALGIYALNDAEPLNAGWGYIDAVQTNALPDGWQLGVSIGGEPSEPSPGTVFTREELLTVVQLARYFMAREGAAASTEVA